jgi:predicted Fe-Mo cluster-binding NifX family protein
MIIAVAYDNGQIGEHFGHAEMFAIYDYKDSDINNCTKRLVDCSDRHGHQAMADLMRDNSVDAVLTGNMGTEAKRVLLSYGIVPVVGYCGDADTAADMLITGRLPILGEDAGSCSGGCGGCSGCGHDEGEDCGCGGCCH